MNDISDIQEPPTLTLDDKDKIYKVKENDDVTFRVKLSGTPKPEAEWYTSGKVVKKSPRIAKTSDEQSASLTIKKVVDEDVGEYTVKIKNPCGEAEANLTLIIMSKFHLFYTHSRTYHIYFSQKNHQHLVHLNHLK